mmetsp:Transcript_18868/g.16709  ORF Transcript_18868/g.16709 Transcript_18868/m.16709 type:complete len:91 (-) Transcript_18868:566-838(-)
MYDFRELKKVKRKLQKRRKKFKKKFGGKENKEKINEEKKNDVGYASNFFEMDSVEFKELNPNTSSVVRENEILKDESHQKIWHGDIKPHF